MIHQGYISTLYIIQLVEITGVLSEQRMHGESPFSPIMGGIY